MSSPIFPAALRFCDDKSAAPGVQSANFRGKSRILNLKFQISLRGALRFSAHESAAR
jgi:hypothetical protein